MEEVKKVVGRQMTEAERKFEEIQRRRVSLWESIHLCWVVDRRTCVEVEIVLGSKFLDKEAGGYDMET